MGPLGESGEITIERFDVLLMHNEFCRYGNKRDTHCGESKNCEKASHSNGGARTMKARNPKGTKLKDNASMGNFGLGLG